MSCESYLLIYSSETSGYQIGVLKKNLTNGRLCAYVEDSCAHVENSCTCVENDQK